MDVKVSVEYVAYGKITVTTPFRQKTLTLIKGSNFTNFRKILPANLPNKFDAIINWYPEEHQFAIGIDNNLFLMPKETRQVVFVINI